MVDIGARRQDGYRRTLLLYYEEEIMGEAYFDALAESFDGTNERGKLRLLARVERHAAETVAPLLRRHGLTARDEAALESLGAADAVAHQGYDWAGLLAYMVDRYPGYVDDFEALERIAPKADLPALKRLTRHEHAAIEFAKRELAGAANSTAPLHRYLEECMVQAPGPRAQGAVKTTRTRKGECP